MGLPAEKLQETMSFDDLLTQTAKPKTTKAKAKSKIPVLEATEDIKETVDRYIEAKKAEKTAKAEKEDAADILIQFVRPHQDKDGYNGIYRHSYIVLGNVGKVKYVSSNRFSINPDDEPELRELFGNQFDNLIEKKFEVKLKPNVFEDESLKNDLMELIGPRFGEFFDATITLKTKDGFDRMVYGVVGEGDMAALRTFARPYKPSLR